jgi:hypothetical protein
MIDHSRCTQEFHLGPSVGWLHPWFCLKLIPARPANKSTWNNRPNMQGMYSYHLSVHGIGSYSMHRRHYDVQTAQCSQGM